MHQENVAIKTKRVYILSLYRLLKYFEFKKSLKEITSQNLIEYLGEMHKEPNVDPDQK